MALRDVLSIDEPRAIVECPEWGQPVHVRALWLDERTKLSALANSGLFCGEAEQNATLTVWMVIYGAIEPDGTNAFTPEDYDSLRKKNAKVIERLAEKIGELSGLGQSDGLEKNSATTPSDGSSSA